MPHFSEIYLQQIHLQIAISLQNRKLYTEEKKNIFLAIFNLEHKISGQFFLWSLVSIGWKVNISKKQKKRKIFKKIEKLKTDYVEKKISEDMNHLHIIEIQ